MVRASCYHEHRSTSRGDLHRAHLSCRGWARGLSAILGSQSTYAMGDPWTVALQKGGSSDSGPPYEEKPVKPDGQGANSEGSSDSTNQTPPPGNQSDSGSGTPNAGTGTPPPGGTSGTDDGDDRDLEKLRSTVKATRTEADEAKRQLREANEAKKALEAKVAEFETANQTELEKTKAAAEKAQKDLATAQAKARTAVIRSAIMQEATKYAFNDPEDLMLYLDQSKIEMDEDDNPKGIEAMVKKIAEEKKYLLKDERTIIPPPGTTTNTRDGKGLSADEQKRRELEALQQTRSYL